MIMIRGQYFGFSCRFNSFFLFVCLLSFLHYSPYFQIDFLLSEGRILGGSFSTTMFVVIKKNQFCTFESTFVCFFSLELLLCWIKNPPGF